jgi:3-oxoacyl-[acyl-carrier protein] reductase
VKRERARRLEGNVALITGAARGIGAAVSRAFTAEGAAVAVNYRPSPRAESEAGALAASLRAAGHRAIAVAADVSQEDQVEAMVSKVASELGPVDVLVANAAASGRVPFTELDAAEWQRVISTNLDGLFLCARAVSPGMRDRGGGKVVTLSSVRAELGTAGDLHYVTSKAGIVGFTRALARELGPASVCVNCVMLGAIQTEHELENFPDQEAIAARCAERQSIPRRGTTDDVVGAFVFLASGESDFITGQVINVDGGWVNY